MAKSIKSILPTVGFILLLAIGCMIVLNMFQININDNGGFKVLNRSATFEGFKSKKKSGMNNRRREPMSKQKK